MEENPVVKKMLKKLDKSYAPYSNFYVSCAVVTEDGEVYYGVNVENASYGLTICAERSAITNMVTNHTGTDTPKIKKVFVISKAKIKTPPCGACRQVISEFATKDCQVVMPYGDLYQKKHCMLASDLMPEGFSLLDE